MNFFIIFELALILNKQEKPNSVLRDDTRLNQQ